MDTRSGTRTVVKWAGFHLLPAFSRKNDWISCPGIFRLVFTRIIRPIRLCLIISVQCRSWVPISSCSLSILQRNISERRSMIHRIFASFCYMRLRKIMLDLDFLMTSLCVFFVAPFRPCYLASAIHLPLRLHFCTEQFLSTQINSDLFGFWIDW